MQYQQPLTKNFLYDSDDDDDDDDERGEDENEDAKMGMEREWIFRLTKFMVRSPISPTGAVCRVVGSLKRR